MSAISGSSMPNSAGWPDRRWQAALVAAIMAVTLWRVIWLYASKAELGVDEAQYWQWSQSLDWGYFSKPPMIAWIIRASTDLLGSDSTFAVRIAAPLLQGATALLVMWFGHLAGGRATGLIAGTAYLTLPVMSVGSMTMSTDTPMLFFLAASLVAWLRLVQAPSVRWAVTLGLMVGAAILSKYAMLFLLPGLVFAAIWIPGWQVPGRMAGIAAASAGLTVLPNVLWNLNHNFITVQHLANSASWTGLQLHPDEAANFLLSQLAVFGPVFFVAMLWQSARVVSGSATPAMRAAVLLTLPVLAVVTGQALLSHAYANWAVAAAAGCCLIAALSLRRVPRLLAATLVLQGALAVALPTLPALAFEVRLPNGQPLFKRYMGRAELAQAVLDLAQRNGLQSVVATERPLLADLFYAARDSEVQILSTPPAGSPTNHFALTYPVPPDWPHDVLVLLDAGTAGYLEEQYPSARELGRIAPKEGWAAGRIFVALRVPGTLWRNRPAADDFLSQRSPALSDAG